MSAITRSAHSRYAGLLPIEPSGEFLRPIDLEPEYIWFPNGQQSARKRSRWLARFLTAFCTGVAATFLLWQSYGWLVQRPRLIAQHPHPPDVIEPAPPIVPFAEKFNAISFDLDAVGHNNIATGQTATSIEQAPVAKASDVAVESQGDVASLQPADRLTEVKPPETLSEKGKPLASAARPRGSDHRRGGTTEHGHVAPLAPRPKGWSFGLP
jgi:hypothetical protein